MNNSKNLRSLPVIKNGSRADELKSCTVQNIGSQVELYLIILVPLTP